MLTVFTRPLNDEEQNSLKASGAISAFFFSFLRYSLLFLFVCIVILGGIVGGVLHTLGYANDLAFGIGFSIGIISGLAIAVRKGWALNNSVPCWPALT